MQSKAASVKEYLASLPDDRRAALSAVRDIILKNLDKDYEEGMQYGMIGYYVPHRIFPAGYHCDPKQPLPFVGLASQKNHMSLYLMGLYIGPADGSDGDNEHTRWFKAAWQKTGKKLDMGKACLRFKKLDELALDVIGQAVRRMPAQEYIDRYQGVLATMKRPAAKKPTAKKPAEKRV
jgi:hypothetical protein